MTSETLWHLTTAESHLVSSIHLLEGASKDEDLHIDTNFSVTDRASDKISSESASCGVNGEYVPREQSEWIHALDGLL